MNIKKDCVTEKENKIDKYNITAPCGPHVVVPLGYQLVDGEYKKHPLEQEAVQLYFKLVTEYGKNPPEEIIKAVYE